MFWNISRKRDGNTREGLHLRENRVEVYQPEVTYPSSSTTFQLSHMHRVMSNYAFSNLAQIDVLHVSLTKTFGVRTLFQTR
jgi:hypothetical protein